MGNMSEGIVKRSNAYFVDPAFIVRRKNWNPRFDFGEIDELAKSIKTNGVLIPLRLKKIDPNLFELVDGDRRFTAIEKLMKKGHIFEEGIPAIFVDRNIDDMTALIQMFESNTGKPFTPLEEAAAYKRMRDSGMSIKDIQKAVGRGDVHITNTLALLDSTDELKEAIKKGEIKATQAKQIAIRTRTNKEKQKEMVATAKKGKEGRRRIDVELSHMPTKKTAKPRTKALTVEQINEQESVIRDEFTKLLDLLGGVERGKIKTMIASDDKTSLAFYYGALQGMRFAKGEKAELKV